MRTKKNYDEQTDCVWICANLNHTNEVVQSQSRSLFRKCEQMKFTLNIMLEMLHPFRNI